MAGSLGVGALSIAQPQRQNTKAVTLAAPIMGINTTGSVYGMSPLECIYSFNLIPSEFGLRSRLGFRERANGMTGDGIRTIVPYDGVADDHADDRIFCATNDALWDCTVPGPAVDVLTFANQGAESGYGNFAHYVNDDASDFLLAAFNLNGLFEYDPSLDTWAAVTGINFPVGDPTTEADIVFIVSHKQRLWLVPAESSHAYYLPVGDKQGDATRFDFGNKFTHGGELVGLYNWTIDGGEGVDDYLLAVSGGGDVIMYKGQDPASADTWTTTGTWFVGEMPSGRRGVSEVGGDVWIMSTQGLITASSLVRSVTIDDNKVSPAFKISRLIRNRMYTEKDERGWEVALDANEGQFVINSPDTPNGEQIQYVFNLIENAWGLWRGVPAKTLGNWNGRFYIGGEDTILWEMGGAVDYVYLDLLDGDPQAIQFSLLSTYQDYDEPSTFKRVQYMRPTFIGDASPTYAIVPMYDYNIQEPILNFGSSPSIGGVWDDGVWEVALWGGTLTPFETLRGGGDMGRVFAYGISGECTARTTLVAVDMMWDTGGFT